MSKRLFLLISFVVVVGLVGSAAAEDKTWQGTDNNWFNADNWSPPGVPAQAVDEYTGDEVFISGGETHYPIISTTDPCATCKKLWLGAVLDSGDAYLTIEDGGELTIRSYETGTGNKTFALGAADGTHGILTMNGGTIKMTVGEDMEIGACGASGDGTFEMNGGNFIGGDIGLTGFGAGGVGTLNARGGVIDCNTYTMSSGMFGTLNVYDGGKLYTDFFNCWDGYKVNLYGGLIDSESFRFVSGFTQMDIYGGVWINRTQVGNNDSTWALRYYATNLNPTTEDYYVVAYGGRGTYGTGDLVIEWTNQNHPDPNQVITENDLVSLMDRSDANTYDPNVYWWIRSAFDPNGAYWPEPEDGFAGASPEQTLSWTEAYNGKAALHDVYFSDVNATVVSNANSVSHPNCVYIPGLAVDHNYIDRTAYWPTPLEMGGTYYWRIDEVNATEPGSPWKGTVWSFSINYVGIEGFETYTSTTDLKSSWVPGHLYHYTALETTTAASGAQSLKLYPYSFFAESYGSGEVTYTFAEDQDWSPAATGARILGMSYLGDAANPVDNGDKIYVRLTDSLANEATQWLNDDNAIAVTSWSEVLFSLKDFDGVDLSKVKTITLGIGQDPPKNTSVMFLFIWFDELKLYLPQCNTSYLRAPGDINGNCVTDFSDLSIMVATGNWLVSNWDVEVTAPAVGPVLHYEFEGDANDSSGNGYDGTVTDPCAPTYVAGHIGQALVFNGSSIEPTHVDVPLGFLSTIDKEVTVSVWLNSPYSGVRTVFGGEPNDGDFGDRILYLMLSGGTANLVAGNEQYADPNGTSNSISGSLATGEFVDEWTHWAFTKDSDANEMAIYVNGELLASESLHNSLSDCNVAIAGIYSFIIGCNQRHDGGYGGMMDDFRVYDYAMTQGEVLSLAGETVGSTFIQPFGRLLVTSANINLNDDGVLDVIDFKDFAVLADTWLQTWTFGEYPDEIY